MRHVPSRPHARGEPAFARQISGCLRSNAQRTCARPWVSWQKAFRGQLAPIRDAGLVFHGLRKSAVVTLLEAGCTDAEVSAITGQTRQMVEHYAR